MRNAEREHYKNLLLKNKNNLKKSWSIIKEVINHNKSDISAASREFIINNNKITNPSIIANSFNNYYVNVGPALAENISQTDISPTTYIFYNNESSLFLNPTNEEEVKRIISQLKEASPGCDTIHSKIVKKTFEYFADPLVHILNLSLSQGIFPNELKLAKVIPIYKAGDIHNITNYRPVSVLPIFSKIFEQIMYTRLNKFINDNDILYKYQFGFRKNHNTSLALMILLDKIYDSFNDNKHVVGIFLDLRKAFDTIDHGILLKKLYKYGIRGVALNWIENYLSCRKQFVSYLNTESDSQPITCGVPQGSILGPLLFILYINDLANISNEIFPILFADDSNLFFSGKNLTETINLVNAELIKVYQWLNLNKLSLNIEKTNFIIFSLSKNVHQDIYNNIVINGSHINRVYFTKFLGVIIDSKLTWKNHITKIRTKISKAIGIICKSRKLFNQEILVTLYYSFVYPYFIYCIENWGLAAEAHLSMMLKLQRKIVRIIMSAGY